MASWTQEDVDALKAAIRGGVRTVKYAGPPAREITYQDIDKMLAALADMEASVAGGERVPYRLAATRKGF